MDRLGKYFLILFWIITAFGFLYSIYTILTIGVFTPWLGVLTSLFPNMIFALLHISRTTACTHENLWNLILFPIFGIFICLSIEGEFITAAAFSFILLVSNFLYISWYSKNSRPQNPLLQVGRILPNFSLKMIDGKLITSSYIKKNASLILFVRGNWCSHCMKQIKEISQMSDILYKDGINIYIVAAQSLEETQEISYQYPNIAIKFLFDPYFKTVDSLNLLHINGKPRNILSFDRDTIYPTALLTNNEGRIIWSDQDKNCDFKPISETLMSLKPTMQNNIFAMQMAHP